MKEFAKRRLFVLISNILFERAAGRHHRSPVVFYGAG